MMMNIRYNEQPVLLTKEVAKLYSVLPKEIGGNFLKHLERFEEGEHFYLLEDEELEMFKKEYPKAVSKQEDYVFLWTDKGLYEHALLLNGKNVWRAYCEYIYHNFEYWEKVQRIIRIVQNAASFIETHPFSNELMRGCNR